MHAATMPCGAEHSDSPVSRGGIVRTHDHGLVPLAVESPILTLDQIGKPAIFDALSRAYVRDSRFPFVFFRYDHHAWVCSRCERNHKGICTGPSFDSIDEPGMFCH